MQLQIIDYVILGIILVGFIIGLVKGFIKQLLNLIGVVGVVVGTAYLFVFPKQWLSGLIANETVVTIVAIVATLVVLGTVYGIVAHFIKKAFKSVKVMKVIDRIFGMLTGVAVAYAVVAVVIAVLQTDLMPTLKGLLADQIENSLIINTVYSNNFFGDWVCNLIREGVSSIIPQEPAAMAQALTTLALQA